MLLTSRFPSAGLAFDTFDYFSDQPWFLDDGYLGGLSPTAAAFFQRFVDTFHGRIERQQQKVAAAACVDEAVGTSRQRRQQAAPYMRYLAQAREQMETMGFDAGVLARL